MDNRVAITGLGIVSPLGNHLEEFRENLLRGNSGISKITRFPTGALESRIAGECRIENRTCKDIKVDFALQASDSAIKDAGLVGDSLRQFYSPEQCSISMGVGLELFDMHDMVRFTENDYRTPSENSGDPCFLQTPGTFGIDEMCRRYSFVSAPAIHVSACAAATDAIGHAFLSIRRGQKKIVLAGGTDSMLNPLGLAGFCKLQAVSTCNEDPAGASKPFDLKRDGFVLGEGAGVLVLENMDSAIDRGARIYGEIVGYGNAFDAYSVSDPHPEGLGACLAMKRAFQMAKINKEQISYINAHGTSTPKNDIVETIAIKKIFGDHARKIPISSTKSMIGHLISAAGAVEMIAAIVCAKVEKVHPTINLHTPDPECDLDYVANECRKHQVEYFQSNSFAFGGQNASLICRINQ